MVLAKIAYENKKKILINPKNFKLNPHEEGYNEVYLIVDSCEKEYLPSTILCRYFCFSSSDAWWAMASIAPPVSIGHRPKAMLADFHISLTAIETTAGIP